MKSKKVKAAIMLSMAMASMTVPVYAEEEKPSYPMEDVVVEETKAVQEPEKFTFTNGLAKEEGGIGLLGNKDVMDTPFNVVTLGQESFKNFAMPGQAMVDVLTLNPSVRSSGSSLYNDVSIRGFNLSGHNMYINGISGLLCQENIPTLFAEDVSVISGPGVGINGSTLSESAGGTVNIQSKRAQDEPNSDLKMQFSGRSAVEESIDIGERFGEDKRYGIRINASNLNGETAVKNEKIEKQNFFINLDQKNENSKSNLLIGYDHTNHQAGPWSVSFKKTVTALPGAPDGSENLKPDWSYNEYDNWIVALNHDQKLSEHVTAFVNAGYHREDWYGYIDGSPSVLNNAGDYSIGLSNYPLALTKKYLGIGLKGDFTSGVIKHNYMINLDKNWQTYNLSNDRTFGNNGTYTVNGNLYAPGSWLRPELTHHNPKHSQDVQMTGWHITDTMSMLDDKLQLILGLHGHQATKDAYSTATGAKTSSVDSSATCPTFGIVYQATPKVSVYANHSESFGMGTMVSNTGGYANGGEILDPSKTKQNELGVKVRDGDFLHTLSAFQIKQANAIDVMEGAAKYLRLDGEQENKGFEYTAIGTISDKVDLIGGFMYLDAKQTKTKNGLNDGLRVNGAAKWSGSLGAVYKATDDFSVLARAVYLGDSQVNVGSGLNSLDVPSHLRFDLGAKWKTKINNTPVTIDAMCYNITDKNYWQARAGQSSLVVGSPRTFVLSATMSL